MRTYELAHLSDGTVGRNLDAVIGQERCATATVLAYIAEFDHRRLYLPAACSSMFNYCVERLHLSEAAAIKRIRAGRAARRFPQIFDAIASGRLHLSGVVVLAPFLKPSNVDDLLDAASHKTKADVERLVAERFPKPDVPTRIRVVVIPSIPVRVATVQRDETKLTPGSVSLSTIEQSHVGAAASEAPAVQIAPPAPRPILKPLAPERFAIQFTIGQAAYDKLRYVQALLSHRLPSGDIAEVFERALDALATQLEKEKFAATDNPQSRTSGASADPRHIPAEVLRAVWKRDQGQCTFVSRTGQRCSERKCSSNSITSNPWPAAAGRRRA